MSEEDPRHGQRHLITADILPADRNSFAVVRLCMALAVLVSHCFYLQAGTVAAEPLRQWTGYTLGQHAVQVFFILSGVLVAQSLDRSRSVLDFLTARGLRIFPGLIVCVMATALVAGPLVSSLAFGDYVVAGDLRAYFVRTLSLSTGMATLPGVFEANPAAGVINSSIWTLKYEVLCYAVLAVGGGLIVRLARPSAALLVALATWVVFVSWAQPALFETNGLIQNTRYFLLFFGTGVIAYIARHHTPLRGIAAICLLGGAAALNDTVLREAAMAVALAYVMIFAAQYRLGPVGALANRTDMSYGVYLYSVPLTQLVLFVTPNIGLVALIGVTVILSCSFAYASWTFVENPALSFRRSVVAMFGARRREGLAAV